MGAKSAIEWTDATWTPLRARVKSDAGGIAEAKGYTSLIQIATKMAGRVGPHCEHVGHGCDNCYSETGNGRCLPANGTGLPFDRRSRDLIEPFVDEKILMQPLQWKKGRRIFTCSQTDLFGEWVSDEAIDRVFAVMALCPQHTFQVLTKRPERMLAYLTAEHKARDGDTTTAKGECALVWGRPGRFFPSIKRLPLNQEVRMPWPLPNVWLGVSVENQETRHARIPPLQQTPAAIRFVSQEPQLAAIDWQPDLLARISQIIIGGESGPGARPFDIRWARNTIAQCRAAGVACFVKQMGSNAVDHLGRMNGAMFDRKGGNWYQWPEDLRVREFPDVDYAAGA